VVELMKARGLSEADVAAALKTYTPTGKFDEYLTFASGGHSGQVLVIGVPSHAHPQVHRRVHARAVAGLRLRRPDQGTSCWPDATAATCRGPTPTTRRCPRRMRRLRRQFLFIGDKANARVAVIDLRDFATKQIVQSELIMNDHGAAFVTPNTDYVIETAQMAAPLGGGYAPLSEYNDKYRGAQIYWKFDRAKGRIIKEESWAIELPPYMQDLADAGKGASDGWTFCNSVNTERATGGNRKASPRWSRAPRRTTWTSCTSSTGGRPKRSCGPARRRPSRACA
jgi:nitrous-oxide reductase